MAGLQQGSKWWLSQVLCLFTSNRAQLRSLVLNRPFTEVQKIVNGHAKNRFHANAVTAAMEFQQSVETSQGNININVRSNDPILQRIQENSGFDGQEELVG